ncbi:hypothetical protein PX554_04370 [Sphingomonas sp. H39-1-10]|uniref:hypothetical protein n=1 Tax=Sphingomonas TaxID=13687 RepID=UPI000887EBC7|nr:MULTISPECIES: hypothetical protein [Sphingomonas]MDF0487354.1 hypothetical protein [Sphingomonas pollutisoli]SDA15675.1 hypothetical protein SAMN03159340_00735 [Sphingomonas sp. NFR15]
MRGGLYRKFAALTAVALAGGCVQSTRHSNTLLFGTNTHFGIRAGTSPTSVPEVNIGYSRQEAVVMPLVANVADDGHTQKPCDLTTPVTVVGGSGFAVHPCSLVAMKGEAQDSYSVLASFGATFDAGARVDGSSGKGGLAQYFATGMAAQILAYTGGASVVAVGDAAKEAARKGPPEPATLAALFGGETAFTKGVAMRDAYSAFRDGLLAKITLTDPRQLGAKMKAFEAAAGATSVGVADDCTAVDPCRKAVTENDPYRPFYTARKAAFDAAFAAWTIP